MIKKTLFLAGFLGLFMSLTTVAAEQSSIGTVIMVQGKAYASNLANVKRTLQRRSDVYLKDTIATAADSKVQLRLKDDSIIIVQPLSKFAVNEFSFDSSDPKRNRYVGNIIQGALINISGQGKPENYQLRSPLAAITFRGTGLLTKLEMRGNVPIKQDLDVFKGYVTVETLCDQQRIMLNFCVPSHDDVGVGQRMSAATITAGGRILNSMSNPLLNSFRLEKTVTKSSSGTVSVGCVK